MTERAEDEALDSTLEGSAADLIEGRTGLEHRSEDDHAHAADHYREVPEADLAEQEEPITDEMIELTRLGPVPPEVPEADFLEGQLAGPEIDEDRRED